MSIYSTFDAYKHLQIGMSIGYYIGDPYQNKIADGIITAIEPCDGACESCLPCKVLIGIDNQHPTCFRYTDVTGIRYVIKKDFLKESDFKL